MRRAKISTRRQPRYGAGSSCWPKRRTRRRRRRRRLTPRERDVLEQLARGAGNKAIAQRLGLSEHTVKFHVASILAKLGAATRTQAVTIGVRRGMVML
ncbi:MAG: response regulator transcription factor [Candidatus Velthaea sp.]